MKNIKFFIKFILALLPVMAVIVYTALVPFGYMDNEYPVWKYTKDSTLLNDSPYSTLILGDSRAMACLIPDILEESASTPSAINLSVGGATSIEMYYTLNKYIRNNGAPENVIIMFAPFHYTIIDNFWTRTAYFNYLSPSELYELYGYAEASGSETLLNEGYKNDLLSYSLRFPDKYLPALINSRFITRYAENSSIYDKTVKNQGYGEYGTADGCSELNYETSYDRMHTTGDAVLLDLYLNKLLKLCSENGIKTVLTIPPMNESSYRALNTSYVEDFTSYINDLKIKYPAVKFDGEIIYYSDSYFGDSSHLNRKGAEKYSREFRY